MIRTFIFILFFVFILFSFSYAGDIVDVSCPANKPVEVSFEWSSNKDIVVASNNSSFTLPETFVGVYSYFKIPAYSDSTGVVRVVYSSGTLRNFICSDVVSESITYWQLISFFIGALTGISFVIASAMRW